jgi:hypothetical protein
MMILAGAHPRMAIKEVGTGVDFQFRNEQFFARSRKSRDCAEAYRGTSHKRSRRLVSLRLIDAEIAKKGHLWMETR